MQCPYCKSEAEFITSKEFYGRDYGTNLYLCRPCNAYVGTHGNSKKALGTMANVTLRALRKACHQQFDRLWRGKCKRMSRSKAYVWLQQNMDLTSEKAHIGMFDELQCQQLLKILKNKF